MLCQNNCAICRNLPYGRTRDLRETAAFSIFNYPPQTESYNLGNTTKKPLGSPSCHAESSRRSLAPVGEGGPVSPQSRGRRRKQAVSRKTADHG